MKTILSVSIALSLLFVSPTSSSTSRDVGNVSMDEVYKKRIVGKWSEGEAPYGIGIYEEGGTYKAWIYETAKKDKLLHSLKGRWWIEKGRLYNTLDEISPAFPPLSVGDVTTDIIVDMTDDLMTLIDDDGRRYTNRRVRE
jgi:hypothetical protein